MKRFQITEAEYEAIKAKEAKTKDKNISRRLRVLMLRYEGKKLDEITNTTLFLNIFKKARECVIMKTVMRNETFSNNRSGI